MYETDYSIILDAETADAPEFLVKNRSARAKTRKNRKYQMHRRLRNMYTWSVPAEEWYEVEKAREKGENAEKCIGRIKGILSKRVLVGTSRKYYYFDDIGMRQFLNYRPCEMRKLNECEDQLKDEDAWSITKKKKRMFMQAGRRDLKKMYQTSTNGSALREKYNITDFHGVPDYKPVCC